MTTGSSDEPIRLAVFGASGRTGGAVVRLALSRGHGVRALVRSSTQFDARPGVFIVRGSLEEPADAAATVSGAGAVLIVFGPRSTSDPPFCARATANVMHAMKVSGVRRVVCLTGAMVGYLPANISLPMRLLAALFRRQVPHLAADSSEQERIVMASDLDWTLVKPPRLTDGPTSGRVRADPTLRVGLMSRISRSDLASFLLDEAALARHPGQRVYVSA